MGLFLIFSPVAIGTGTGVILALTTLFCILGLWFFMKGYKKGLAVRLARWLSHLPWVGKWARRMIDEHREQLETVDRQIAALHRQNPLAFVSAVGLELLCRFLSSFELMFVLLVLSPHVDYISCVLMLAFTSLFANLLFFIPLQLGGREGGFMMSAAGARHDGKQRYLRGTDSENPRTDMDGPRTAPHQGGKAEVRRMPEERHVLQKRWNSIKIIKNQGGIAVEWILLCNFVTII